ncbi:unnamed protein product [Coregonus sp. 'balchen']|nr:unnamed protein product [Coregonus sp. 'balchen']
MEGSGGASGVESQSLQEEMEQGSIRGIREDVKRRAVLGYLEGVGFDVCFIQEVHIRDSGDVIRFKREWDKGESVWGMGGCTHRGEVKVEGTLVGMQGRVLGVDVTVRDDRYRVIVVYGPQLAAGRREMVDCLAPLCATNRHLVIGGDFNIDIGRGRDSSAGAIAGLMACHGLVDGGLHTAPTMAGPTWRNSRGVEQKLDYIFLSRSLDHDGVLLQVGETWSVAVGGRMCLGGLSLCIGALKILWVLFETPRSATLNWNRSIAVVQRKLGMWRARSLSFIGKVLVLKVDVLPSLLYMAFVYPLPASLRRPLVRLVFQFMWGGRLERVARVRMLFPIGEGGRGVPHSSGNTPIWLLPAGVLLLPGEKRNGNFGYAAKWLRGHPEVEVARVGLDHRHLYEEVRRGGCPGPVLDIPAVVWEGVQVLKDLNWLSLHKGLPVRSILYGRGMTRSPTCPRPTCGGEETLRHVFWGYAFAGVVWARAQVLIGRVRGDFVVTWARVERGVGKARGMVRDSFLL